MSVNNAPKLVLVASDTAKRPRRAKQTVTQQLASLQTQQRKLVQENIAALITKMEEVAAMDAEIAAGGDAYPAGIRELLSRVGSRTRAEVATIKMLATRIV